MSRPKPVAKPQQPDVTREEAFDFAAEKEQLAGMTDAELRDYGRKHAKAAASRRLDQPAWHDVYRHELAKKEWRRRHQPKPKAI